MDNVFNKAAGASSNRKFHNHAHVARFSPSYGVRKGFIKDPNWPPAQFPEEGNATQRRFRRMPSSFEVAVAGGESMKVKGNISSGGVMFMSPAVINSQQIEVKLGDNKAMAEIIAHESKGAQFMVRARFTDVSDAAPIWIHLVKQN